MKVTLIAAQSLNGTIGLGGQIPWHLPTDMAFFKRMTVGNVVVMGRKTFESLGRPLPERRNIVLTRDPAYAPEGVEVCGSLDEVHRLVGSTKGQDVYVIGGEQIYRAYLPMAARIYLTVVDAVVTGDAFFPRIHDAWSVKLLEEHRERPTKPLRGNWFPHRMYELHRAV